MSDVGTKKDVDELHQSLADLTIVVNDLAKNMRASNDRTQSTHRAEGR